MASSSVVDFSAIIGRNRHYQPARIASIRPRPAFVYNNNNKQEEYSSRNEQEYADSSSPESENASQDVVCYVVDDDDNGEKEDEDRYDEDEEEPEWIEWMKSDIEVAAEQQLRKNQRSFMNNNNYNKQRSKEERDEKIKIDCEKHARKLIRHTNYIRSRNLEDDDDLQSDINDSQPSSDTFYSWLAENSHCAETLFCPQQRQHLFGVAKPNNAFNASSLSPAFHEIEQSNWESKINWEGTPTTSSPLDSNTTGTTDPRNIGKTAAAGDSASWFLNRLYNPILVDDSIDFSKCINWEGADAPPETHQALKNSVPLILEDSVAGSSVARLFINPRRPTPLCRSEVYLRRCQIESNQGNNNNSNMFYDNEKDETVIAKRQEKRAKMAVDKSQRVIEAMGTLDLGGGKGRTITSSLMGPGGTERTGRPTKGITSSAYDAEHVEQLDLVLNHQLVKPDLKKNELRHFHRPRLPRHLVRKDRVWQLKIRRDNNNTNPLHQNNGNKLSHGRGRSLLLGAHHPGAISQVKIKSESDLTAAEGDLIILEYCEERLPVQMAKGTACKIINYYRGDKSRCPISAGGGDRPPKVKRGGENINNNNDTNTSVATKIEKPRFDAMNETYDAAKVITDLVVAFRKNNKQNQDNSQLDDEQDSKQQRKKRDIVENIPEGVTEMLLPKVQGPFIGEVEDGQIQSGVISNLFVAPIFRHDPDPTDFLLTLGKKPNKHHHQQQQQQPVSNNNISVILRPFPASVYCCGQIEPRVKAWAPNTSGEKGFVAPFQTYQIAKCLTWMEIKEGHGMRFDEISERLFANTRILQNALRQRIKQVAVYDKNTQIWATKPIGVEDYPGVEALGRRISPESVATYESSCSYVQRLTDLGIHDLYNGVNSVQAAGQAMMYLNGAVNAARERKSKMSRMAENAKTMEKQGNTTSQVAIYEQAAAKLEEVWKEAKRKQEVARFIYEELVLAPWHLTQEFIDIHKNAQGTAMMKLTGIGDPSGRGEGYNFMREVDAKPNKITGNTDGALSAQIKKITGTENDLRKLTMKEMASLLRSYGMRQKDIDTLKRWDRVHCIRDLSTKAASDGMGDGLEKFARGEKMKLSDQKQMYRDRVQEIWRRQRASLSTDAGTFDADKKASAIAAPENSAAAEIAKQEQENDADESDSDSDDDYEAMLEEAMMDGREANRIVADQLRGDSGGPVSQLGGDGELRDDARELAAFRRQQEEERATKEGLLSTSGFEKKKVSMVNMVNRKCIRRKVTKTHPDGTQTVTFEFIVAPEQVDRAIAIKKYGEDKTKYSDPNHFSGDGKKKNKVKSIPRARSDSYHGGIVGHALFEDDDEEVRRTGIKLKLQRVEKRTKVGRSISKTPKLKQPKKPKLMIVAHKEKEKAEKKRKKRQREAEEAELYSTAPHRKGTSNRRERGSARERMPHVIMKDRLESIRAQVEARPLSGPFKRPVNRRMIPRYFEIISDPMDLQTIRDKNARYEFKTADAFLKDFELMKNNAIKFNGVGHNLGNEATAIYDFVRGTIESNREELTKMEYAVKDQMMSGKKRIKIPNARGSPCSQASEALSQDGPPSLSHGSVANVMLDGVETTVNLGNIEMNAFNFDDVSDSGDDSMALALRSSEV